MLVPATSSDNIDKNQEKRNKKKKDMSRVKICFIPVLYVYSILPICIDKLSAVSDTKYCLGTGYIN